MLSRLTYSLIIGLSVFGIAYFIQPQTVFAGHTPLGCCINNSGNCAGGCGSEASDCATHQLGSCPNVVAEADCDATQGDRQCFVLGSVCNQASNTLGVCGPGSGDSCSGDIECEGLGDGECVEGVCLSGSCVTQPVDGAADNPNCTPTASNIIIPTMGQWGMLLAALIIGAFAIIRLRSVNDSEFS